MGKIIDIDALLPDDTTIRWRGREWQIPGDISVERILALQKRAQQLVGSAQAGDQEAVEAAYQGLADEVAGVLAERQPEDAQGLKFGIREVNLLAGVIVSAASGQDLKAAEPSAQETDPGKAEAAVAP